MSQNESLTTEEVAAILKVSKLTVYDLIKKGTLPSYRVGRQIRVDANELENYKAKGKGTAPLNKGERTHTTGDDRMIIISGQDNCLDILARELEEELDEYRFLRSHSGSLDSLIELYKGSAHIVSTHLLDGDTGEYNVSYARKLLVSKPFTIVHLIARQAGLYVAKGNPKQIHSWEDLKRSSITIVNREAGAGARVLLDEQLRIHRINRSQVKGYANEKTSHMAIAGMIASGEVDAGVGIEQVAKTAPIDFVPLITESYDLVMLNKKHNTLVDAVITILQSSAFKRKLAALGYDTRKTGKIIYEQ
ncbi:substrate-binding domain-containing protein [Virgibacillus sp. W0430]|uniref:substrate-binding domain-containing protein n=1 Tax=Virgibacillus sp. W0430 TaxID=3391580 RepID=UPI003F44682D